MIKRKINFALKSKQGIRKENQDALLCAYNKSGEFCAIVCDGIGSIPGSQFASQLVSKVFTDEFKKTKIIGDVTRWCKQTLALTLKELEKTSRKLNLPGIGTTLAMAIITNDYYYTLNIGDTRIYQIDEKEAKQVSFDHNYRNYLIRKNTPVEIIEREQSKWKCLTNFIDATHPSAAQFEANSGLITGKMMLLICTDGLYNSLTTDDIHKQLWLKKSISLSTKTNSLVNYCLKKDNTDNISCIVLSIK